MTCNVISEYVKFSRNCLKKYAKTIMKSCYEPSIIDRYNKVYVEARYYNHVEKIGKDFYDNIGMALRQELKILINEGVDQEKATKSFKTYKYLLYFDGVRECESAKALVEEIAVFRKNGLGLREDKKFVDEFFKMVQEDLVAKKEFVEKFQTEKFQVEFHLTNKKNVYDSLIEHNLKFPRLYEPKSIKKVFNSKDIVEERSFVEYSHVATQVLKDIIKGVFENEYLVIFPTNVINKKTKVRSLLNTIDDDIAKEKVVLKIKFSEFLEEKERYYVLMRVGYRFAAIIDEDFEHNEENQKILSLFKYVIASPKSAHYEQLNKEFDVIVLR